MNGFDVQTHAGEQMVNITDQLRQAVRDAGLADGVVTAFTPHTSCGLTLTEGCDPAVAEDLLRQLGQMVPARQPHYQHAGGNAAAHIKAALVGSSLQFIVKGGAMQLGPWQGVFLCEFDGPRIRHVWIR
jgi:secondary thiamine-phosphate synthase enzyme